MTKTITADFVEAYHLCPRKAFLLMPELTRGPVELVVVFEGVSDRGDYYLAGLLVCMGGEVEYQHFWADDTAGEAAMWSALVKRLEALPDAIIYHDGSYERKAFTPLALLPHAQRIGGTGLLGGGRR